MFDRGANDKENLERIELDGNDYLTAKKLNMSDDQYFEKFSKKTWECIDADAGVYALKKTFPSRVNYYFFSEKLKKDHLRSCLRQAERLLAEAKASRTAWTTEGVCRSASASTIRSSTSNTIIRPN